jgi:glycosidase
MTLPGAPCIYYGDEIGMAGGNDPFCRAAFPADPSAGDRELRAFVRGLTALRHRHPVLRDGAFTRAGADGLAAAYLRVDDTEAFVVAFNAGETHARLDVDLPELDGRSLVPVSPDGWGWPPGEPVRVAGGRAAIELPARGARLLHAAW